MALSTCSAFIHGYIAFASEMMIQLETQEAEYNEGLEPDPIDWEGIWFQIKRTGPDIWYGTLREWVTEGIRIFYERHAYEAWDRRTVWKFLKSARPRNLANSDITPLLR